MKKTIMWAITNALIAMAGPNDAGLIQTITSLFKLG